MKTILPILLIGLCIVGFILPYILLRRRRRKIAESRSPMPADRFLELMNLDSKYDNISLGIRQGMANQVNMPVEFIYPDDTIEFFFDLTFDGFFSIEFALALQKQLNKKIPKEIMANTSFPLGSNDKTTLANGIKEVLKCQEFVEYVCSDNNTETIEIKA